MRRALVSLSVALALAPASVGAQGADSLGRALDALEALDEAALPEALADPSPLVVHVHRDLEAFAAPLRRSLARRLDGEVVLGAPPPGGQCVATAPGHACVAPLEAHDTTSALVLFVGEDGRFYETELDLPADRAPAVRALSIALSDVRDAARSAPAPPPLAPGVAATPRRAGSSWVYVEREGGLWGRQRTMEPVARPILYLRALVGFSTSGSGVLFGPGVGLGLCVGDACVVIEGDVPVFEERRAMGAGAASTHVSYRPIHLAVRLQYRPLRAGPVTAGITWGLLDRVGNAWLDATGESRLLNDLGMRQSVELAVEIERPFEWVLEVGADVTFSPAHWIDNARGSLRMSETVTGWGVTAIRVRP